MQKLNAALAPSAARPIRVVQFGEGNFLRAFVDYMIDIANEKTDFNGSIVLVKPISIGQLFPAFAEQDNRYTVILRGLVGGEPVEQSRV
ncbi:MAG: tagaturonate reductase, partial [Clostridia bacterium]|nr:tagaturonate reductase [Clostridia bacterium]